MARIVELPESVRVRIAAGEVIERPASVVKELLDNSIDAGAAHVTVEIEGGGRDLVRVADDGCGMEREDLVLSVRRHATSKLASAEDLVSVATLGFRGEALPSIGSVSRMRITTRTAGSDSAWEIALAGGEQSGPAEAAAAPGTTVEVRDLFYNVPVRRRFLRSPSTEGARSAEAVMRMALARPAVAFRLSVDGREAMAAPASQDLRGRIVSVLGREIASSLIEVEAGEGGFLRVCGYVAPPSVSRSSRGHTYVFINGRPVDEPVVIRALRDGYAGALAPRRYPVAFLCLDIDAEEVDVNVHPAKREVRLRSSQAVYRLVHGAVKEAIARTRSAAGLSAPATPSTRLGEGRAAPRADAPDGRAAPAGELTTYDLWAGERTYGAPRPAAGSGAVPREIPAAAERASAVGCHYVGQTRLGYLVAEIGNELRILDPHALHERVIFERLSSRRAASESQGLLTPVPVDLDAADSQLLGEIAGDLAELGFEIEPFGEGGVIVRSVPSVMRPGSVEGCLRDILDRAAEGRSARGGGELRERVLAAISCAGAVKLGERLTAEQALALIEEAERSGVAERCPHGRPTSLVVTDLEIERRFGR